MMLTRRKIPNTFIWNLLRNETFGRRRRTTPVSRLSVAYIIISRTNKKNDVFYH